MRFGKMGARKMMWSGPYKKRIQYLESTGTQYVDTGFVANSDLSVEVTMANAGTPTTNVNPTGAFLPTPLCRHHLNFKSGDGGINYYFGSGDYLIQTHVAPADGLIFTFKVDAVNKKFTLGSFTANLTSGTWSTGLNYWLFARNGTTPPYYGRLKGYAAKLWNGATLVRDLIPVLDWDDNAKMFDRVTQTYPPHYGTFIAGPDM